MLRVYERAPLVCAIAALMVSLWATASRASPAAGTPSLTAPSTRARIVAAVARERTAYGGRTPVPGMLVGVWDGAGHSLILPVGYADMKTRRPMSPADHFRIGSNTKTFVVAVILQLVDEGKLKLDDPLSRFNLGVRVPNAGHITIRQLCDMRSGLFEAYDTPQFNKMNVAPDSIWNPRTAITWAVAQKPYFSPGTGYHYSNTNYLLLGLIIENVTKDSVGNEIRKRLLAPFKLTETSYPATMRMPTPWAHGYALDKNRNWQDVSNTIPVTLMGSAGAMISDMADMKRWMTLYVSGRTSRPATHKALLTCLPVGAGNLSFGLGLGCSAGWYGYTGGLPGYNTADYYFPQRRLFFVAWVPLQAENPKPGVANSVFRDIARIVTPNNVPFVMGNTGRAKSGL